MCLREVGLQLGFRTDPKDAVAIPIGVSYSYKNIELDARYLWGVTKIADTNDLNDKEVMNSTFAITLGYRFHL